MTSGLHASSARPLAAYGAFDQPTYLIDITPFVPTLTDSLPHNFTLTVEGQGEGRSTNSDWYVSGNVGITLDPSGRRTTGRVDFYKTDSNVGTVGKVGEGNSTVTTDVEAWRTLKVVGTLESGGGATTIASFEQTFRYSNRQMYTNGGADQVGQVRESSLPCR